MHQAVGQFRLIERGIGIRRHDDAGHAAGNRRRQFGLDGIEAGAEVDQAGADDTAGRIDGLIGDKAGRRRADADDRAFGDEQGGVALVDPVLRINDAAVLDFYIHVQFPATMLMTAMRTAMPKVTCGRITACAPSATAEWISTPRFIGPGCITMASGLASASFCGVRP